MSKLTPDQLERAVWGTGYGSKKHLIDHDNSELGIQQGRHRVDKVRAICSQSVLLDMIDTSDSEIDRSDATSRPVCFRCGKRAAARGIEL